MDKEGIVKYVMNTPGNTNEQILRLALDGLEDGGSSDLTTAEVTVHNLSKERITLYGPICLDLEESFGSTYATYAFPGDGIIKIAVYKGFALLEWDAIEGVTATGGVTVDNEESATVVGDGTIIFPAGK